MPPTVSPGSMPYTQATLRALQTGEDSMFADDLLFLEAWEIDRPMHLGVMLRIRQIRRANPRLSADIAEELTIRRKAARPRAA
jgi:hypothetical protein